MDEIQVREPLQTDCEAIEEVNRLAIADLRKVYRPNEKALNSLSKFAPALKQLIATKGESVVGTVQFRIEGGCFMLTALNVRPTHRRQGVARALVKAIIRLAVSDASRCVALYTVKETGNVDIFERMGFQVIQENKSDFFESEAYDVLTEVYMEHPARVR